MSDIITNPIKCPNCDTEMSMDEDCSHCGYNDVHDRDTEEIMRVVPVCAADNCAREADVTITVNGQKQEVCDICAEQHYDGLDSMFVEQNASSIEERENREV